MSMVVTHERAARPGPAWARFLLFVSLLLGVATMHTLGHPSESPDRPAIAVSVAAHADPEPVGRTAPDRTAHTDTRSPAMDATSMCLAIGGMAAALIGLAAAVFVPWPGPLLRPPSSIRRLAARAVPTGPPSLAGLQVMRV